MPVCAFLLLHAECTPQLSRAMTRVSRPRVFKSVLIPFTFYRVKMHVPKSRRILPRSGSEFISRAPLSIPALRFARGDRIRRVTKIVLKSVSFFPAQSRPLARLVQVDGSRKLPQTMMEAWWSWTMMRMITKAAQMNEIHGEILLVCYTWVLHVGKTYERRCFLLYVRLIHFRSIV